jgi:hypothetical protein
MSHLQLQVYGASIGPTPWLSRHRTGRLSDSERIHAKPFTTTINTPWDELHSAYFSDYAMWNYLNTPFIFTFPGFVTEEIVPWNGSDGEHFRRLKVIVPDSVADSAVNRSSTSTKAAVLFGTTTRPSRVEAFQALTLPRHTLISMV